MEVAGGNGVSEYDGLDCDDEAPPVELRRVVDQGMDWNMFAYRDCVRALGVGETC